MAQRLIYSIDTTLSKEQQINLIKQIKMGKALYKPNCSKCHGIFSKGLEHIPNFTKVQLDSYSAKCMLNDKVNHAVAEHLSIDELGKILTFLKFKK